MAFDTKQRAIIKREDGKTFRKYGIEFQSFKLDRWVRNKLHKNRHENRDGIFYIDCAYIEAKSAAGWEVIKQYGDAVADHNSQVRGKQERENNEEAQARESGKARGDAEISNIKRRVAVATMNGRNPREILYYELGKLEGKFSAQSGCAEPARTQRAACFRRVSDYLQKELRNTDAATA